MSEHSPHTPDHAAPAPSPAPSPVPPPGSAPVPRPSPPGAPASTGETGDLVIDAALQDLKSADPSDLDAQIEAGQQVHRALQARLSDLGGQ